MATLERKNTDVKCIFLLFSGMLGGSAALAGGPGSSSPGGLAETANASPRWALSLGVGAAYPTDQDVRVDIGGLGQSAPGQVSHDVGVSGAVALSRTLGEGDTDGPRWRAELEALAFGADRRRFDGPGTSAGLRGEVSGYGAFANLLYRVWTRDETRVWVGGGIGYLDVRLPDDRGSIPGCGCLGPDSRGEATWRVKLVAEQRWRADTDLFAELGYTELPGGAAAGGAGTAATRYDDFGLVNLHLGLRRAF